MLILELTEAHGDYLAEGSSEKLMSMEGGTWFYFEDTWPSMAMHLQNLGFTATQILEAKEAG